MTLSLRQLEHVAALCEQGNFRRAAETLGLTQSALSVSIRRIEDFYGVPLFVRDPGGVRPTEYGEVVRRLARQTASTLEEGRREIELLRNLDTGRVVIGSDPWMAEIIVGPALTRMLRKFPRLRFQLRTQGWDELQQELLARRVDVYVGSPFETLAPGIRATSFEMASPVIICRRRHPLTRLPEVLIGDVLPYPLLVPKLPGWYLSWLAEHYGDGTPSEDLHALFLQSDDWSVIRHIVKETDAVTAGVTRAFPPGLSRTDFTMIDIADLSHVRAPVMIATLADRPPPPAMNALVEEVVADIRRLAPGTDQ